MSTTRAVEAEEEPPKWSRGCLGLAQSVPGSVGFWEAGASFADGKTWRIRWNRRAETAQILDAATGNLLGWMEAAGKNARRFKLAGGDVLPVTLVKRWFTWRAATDGQEKPVVFSFDGRQRAFEPKRLRITHRDFMSEVKLECEPGLEVAAVMLGFLLFNAANCRRGEK